MSKYLKSIGFYILLFVLIFLIFQLFTSGTGTNKLIYSDLINMIKNGEVTEIEIGDNDVKIKDKNNVVSSIEITSKELLYQSVGKEMDEQIMAGTLKMQPIKDSGFTWWLSIIPSFIVIILLLSLMFFMFNQGGQGGGGKVMQFGKSRAKMMSEDRKKTNFGDVAGADEEKAELAEVVDFLKEPKKYLELGARIPKGILLVGPPGTGKTLLAKAVAGEAGVPFFSISGSDFVEMFVGVGASRVRDLFEQAKKNSPCIVFIDEIDAVGRQRGAGLGGGHDEREQTLNQMLVEMDGFSVNEGVIIIAATNRPDILDPALLRPGRFDRQIYVGTPDVKGREEILKIHARGKPLSDDVDLKVVAKSTVGFTGADLENIMNEAALLTARFNRKVINMETMNEAIMKVMMGPEKKSRVYTEKEKQLTAYHEAGHAVLAKVLPHCDEVHHVSIVSRGMAGGFTATLPKEDKHYVSKGEMLDNITMCLGGRVAEKLLLDDISTGASNDLEKATKIARNMVTQYGMSDVIGTISYKNENDEVFIGRDFAHSKNYSEKIAAEIDEEVKKIMDSCYTRAVDLISEHMEFMHMLADELLEKENIDGGEFEALYEQYQNKGCSEQQENKIDNEVEE